MLSQITYPLAGGFRLVPIRANCSKQPPFYLSVLQTREYYTKLGSIQMPMCYRCANTLEADHTSPSYLFSHPEVLRISLAVFSLFIFKAVNLLKGFLGNH